LLVSAPSCIRDVGLKVKPARAVRDRLCLTADVCCQSGHAQSGNDSVAAGKEVDNGINGYASLRALLTALPGAQTADDYEALLPWRIQLPSR